MKKMFCGECKSMVPAAKFRQHLIDAHGYVREKGVVFKRYWCSYCPSESPKPAHYLHGKLAACSAHKENLTQVIVREGVAQHNRSIAESEPYERNRKFADARMRFGNRVNRNYQS